MSDRSVTTAEQRGGSPFGREMDDGSRTGREPHPSDPEATSSDDEQMIVERGGRIRDAAAGEVDELRRSRDPPNPHSPPAMQRQQSTVGAAPPVQVRSVVTKPPVQLRLTGGRGRATSGNGVLRLCRPLTAAAVLLEEDAGCVGH